MVAFEEKPAGRRGMVWKSRAALSGYCAADVAP
jgi:hypothetical protein